VTITSSSNGTGQGTVQFTVNPNTKPVGRIARLTIAGFPYTVIQKGSN
jgi:hypothetical protein